MNADSPDYQDLYHPEHAWFGSRRMSGKPEESNRYYLSGLPPGRGPMLELQPGTVLLERFALRNLVGRGSYGSVYLAEDKVRAHEVALKIVVLGPGNPDILPLLLQHELAAYEKISNFEHVIRVHDAHIVPFDGVDLLALSMEYADGGTYRRWILKNKDNYEARRTEGIALFKQICEGVGAVHEAGQVHLDLKPENFLFVKGIPKVSDFGGAKFLQALQSTGGSGWGVQNLEIGTPVYMSPEHFTAPHPDDLGPASDIYSLGIVLYELLHPHCHPPFGGSYSRLRGLHCTIPAPSLPAASDGDLMAQVVARCLQKEPSARYSSVSELLDALEGNNRPGPEADSSEGNHQRDSAHDLYENARTEASSGRLAQARRLCERVLECCPDHPDAIDLLEEIRVRFEQAGNLYNFMQRGIETKTLSELTALLQEAVTIFPDHPMGRVVQAELKSRIQKYRELMEHGSKEYRDGNIRTALASFEDAQRLSPGDPVSRQCVEFTREIIRTIENTRQKIDDALRERKHRKALLLARSLDGYIQGLGKSTHGTLVGGAPCVPNPD